MRHAFAASKNIFALFIHCKECNLKFTINMNKPAVKAGCLYFELDFFLSMVFSLSGVALRETKIKLRARAKSEFT